MHERGKIGNVKAKTNDCMAVYVEVGIPPEDEENEYRFLVTLRLNCFQLIKRIISTPFGPGTRLCYTTAA